MEIEGFVQIFRIQESFDVPAQGSDGAHTWYVESPKSLTGFWALSRWYNTSRAFQDFRTPKIHVFVQIFVLMASHAYRKSQYRTPSHCTILGTTLNL